MAGKKKILIVEDDRPLSKVLSIKLKNSGYEVTNAYNGEEAVEILANDKYDLALLDMVMPKMDGFEVLKKIKDRGIKTPIVVTSNLGQEVDINEAKKLGAVDYLVKSNTPLAGIIEHIKMYLEK